MKRFEKMLPLFFPIAFLLFIVWGAHALWVESDKEIAIDEHYRSVAREQCAAKGFNPELTIVEAFAGAGQRFMIHERDADTLVVTCKKIILDQQ